MHKKLHVKDRDRFVRQLIKHGTLTVAAHYGVSTSCIRWYRRKYLADYVPEGNWRQYKKDYFVFDDGRVWMRKVFRWSRKTMLEGEYIQISIGKEYVLLHRLVLLLFRGKPKRGQQGRHLDGNTLNNSLSNLAWGTVRENTDDKLRHGTTVKGDSHHNAKLNERHVRILRRRYEAGERAIARRYANRHRISVTNVLAAIKRHSWKHVN